MPWGVTSNRGSVEHSGLHGGSKVNKVAYLLLLLNDLNTGALKNQEARAMERHLSW
jgi:hypothetical protein